MANKSISDAHSLIFSLLMQYQSDKVNQVVAIHCIEGQLLEITGKE